MSRAGKKTSKQEQKRKKSNINQIIKIIVDSNLYPPDFLKF